MQHVTKTSGLGEVAAILAAGFLRAKLRAKNQAGINTGIAAHGLDISKSVSVHGDIPGAKGEGR